MGNNIEKIKEIFKKLKDAHDIYVRASEEKKAQIFDACAFLFGKLEALGVDRTFSESLLMFGREFVESVKQEQLTLEGQKKNQWVGLVDYEEIDPNAPATLEDVERIFGAKARDMTPREQREFALARKYNALIWRSIPTDGDTVKIEVLSKMGD